LKTGNPDAVLADPFSVLLTESTAKKYFGNEDPIGKTLSFEGEHNLTVLGILKDIPQNSHFKFDIIISFSSLDKILQSGIPKSWYWNPCWTYVLLRENVNPKYLETLFPEFVTTHYPPARGKQTSLHIQPLKDIHLNSNLDYEIEVNSDIKLVYIFGVIALFILMIAAVNFINLSTARSIKRSKEVGIRKVLGAAKKQLIFQFLSESILLTSIAVLISVPLVDVFLPVLNNLALKEISSSYLSSGIFWLSLLALTIIIGLSGGIYPALFLSSFQPVQTVYGRIKKPGKVITLRKILVVAQFSVSGILIIATIIIYSQVKRLNEVSLGFNKEEVIIIPVSRSPVVKNYFAFKDRIIQHKSVKNVTVSDLIIGTESQSSRYFIEGREDEVPLNTYRISTDYSKTLGMTFIAGRDLSESFPSDTASGGVLVNESFLKFAGWKPEQAIGKKIKALGDDKLEIKGVVKDFHFTSLKQPVVPLIMIIHSKPERRYSFMKFIYVRLETKEIKETISFLEEKYKEFDPARAFSFTFLDERINKIYSAENTLVKVVAIFSFMAIFVACLGLYGLASFSLEQRTKEIGIRKVLGASIPSLINLLSKESFQLVLVSNFISWPVAFYLMNKWLQIFIYKTEISWWMFILTGNITLIIVLMTIIFIAIKAAKANPVKSLKYE
jgi:putative ABC transport system permease protein